MNRATEIGVSTGLTGKQLVSELQQSPVGRRRYEESFLIEKSLFRSPISDGPGREPGALRPGLEIFDPVVRPAKLGIEQIPGITQQGQPVIRVGAAQIGDRDRGAEGLAGGADALVVRRDDDLAQSAGAAGALPGPLDHRSTGDRRERLSGEAGRGPASRAGLRADCSGRHPRL